MHEEAALVGAGRSGKRDWLVLGAAILIALLLAVTALAKGLHPSPKHLVLDRGSAAGEMLVLVGLLVFHERWWAWLGVALMFAGLAGYSLFKSVHGEPCGCFAEWIKPPPYSMFAVDVLVMLVGLGLGLRRGARPALAWLAAAAALGAAGGGWVFADQTTPPPVKEVAKLYAGRTAAERLMESPWMTDIVEQERAPGGPAWLILAHDPDCHICEAMKPTVEFMKQTYEESGDPVMQIRLASIPQAEKELKIESFAWTTPTLFIYANGRITRTWTGKELEGFGMDQLQAIYDKLKSGEYLEPEPEKAAEKK